MRAMILDQVGRALRLVEAPDPEPGPGEVLLEVLACGVCRTDLHLVDGELAAPRLPLIPGHQVVGRVIGAGDEAGALEPGSRVGIPWLGWACGECSFCLRDQENLCDHARFTGFHLDGGFADRVVADADFVLPLPDDGAPEAAAPLLCAGLIGYRAYRWAIREADDVRRLGLYGFGAAAHILVQVAASEGRDVYAFTRPDDAGGQAFARRLGAVWAGPSTQPPPEPLDAAIVFAPVGGLVPVALRAVRKGGAVVCGGIHMSAIPAIPYEVLWGERVVRSVANLTRRDATELLELARRIPIQTRINAYPLADANQALDDLRHGRNDGAAVLVSRETADPRRS